jgi:hypothetical protein
MDALVAICGRLMRVALAGILAIVAASHLRTSRRCGLRSQIQERGVTGLSPTASCDGTRRRVLDR